MRRFWSELIGFGRGEKALLCWARLPPPLLKGKSHWFSASSRVFGRKCTLTCWILGWVPIVINWSKTEILRHLDFVLLGEINFRSTYCYMTPLLIFKTSGVFSVKNSRACRKSYFYTNFFIGRGPMDFDQKQFKTCRILERIQMEFLNQES